MHILNLLVENYKRIKFVEIARKGRLTAITGKNGQRQDEHSRFDTLERLDSFVLAVVGKRLTFKELTV